MCVLVLVTYHAHSTSQVRTFLGSEDVLAGHYNYKGTFFPMVLILMLERDEGERQGKG